MANGGRHGRRGKVNRKATRRPVASRRHDPAMRPEEAELIRDIRSVLRRGDPLGLAQFVSAMLRTLGEAGPTAGHGVAALVDSFIAVPLAETSAVLHAIAAMGAGDRLDELLEHRIQRELAHRSHPLPRDVTELADVTVGRAVVMTDPLGDGEDVLLELTGAGLRETSFLTYVDHNLGHLLKDAFIAPTSLEELMTRLTEIAAEDGLTAHFEPISLADARARIESAVAAYDASDSGVPDTVTWPHLRALLLHCVRQLPAGGAGYPARANVTLTELLEQSRQGADLAKAFLDSSERRALGDPGPWDDDLAQVFVQFTRAFLDGDPLRWSPVTAEIALDQGLPIMLNGHPDEYARVPALLGAFVRYAHATRGVDQRHTEETLAAIARWTPGFLARRDDPTLVAARAGLQLALEAQQLDAQRSWPERVLLEALGSEEAIERLDAVPLPDEPLDLSAVPADVHERVCRVAALTDRVCEQLFDVEIRTAVRRLLARVSAADPAIFRRRSKDETAAAAAVWIIARANDAVGFGRYAVASVGEVMAALGVSGSPSQRAEPMLRALGMDPYRMYGEIVVGTPDLLTGDTRERLMRMREALAEE